MSAIVLHHCHQARSMQSLWLLHELGVPFDLMVHEFGPDLRDPDYLAISPLGRVPALRDGAVTMFESGAICEYLCEQYDPGMLWRWPGHVDRPAWLQWLHFAETIGQHLANLTQQHIVIRDDADRSPLIMKLELRRLEKALEVLSHALQGREYLLPGGFCAADIGIGYDLYIARHFTDLSAFSALEGYIGRLTGRAAFRKAVPPPGAQLIYTKPFYAAWPHY